MTSLFGLGSINILIATAIVSFIAYLSFANHHQNVGAEKAIRKIEKASRNAASKGKRAANKSRSGSVRGIPDPITRN